MSSSLESLLAEGVISEIYGRLKTGKEAEVYAVAYGDQVVAAKVYKDRGQRSFKSNAAYKEGRAVRSSRSQRAMDRGSRFGQEAAEEAWKTEEANALYKLHAAGVRVPQPVMFLDGVLLMELVRGADGEAAPRLIDALIGPEQARDAYRDMLGQLVRILSCDLIHGDLSPYNVLWAASGPTIIDFPQIVSAAQNNSSEMFFMRDAKNILGHFASIEPSLRGRLHNDAREIWRAYVRRELSPEFMPTGRAPAPEPRSFEQRPRSFDRPREDRGPRPRDDRGPRPRDDRGSRPQSGERPRLQMASPQANRASQSAQSPQPQLPREPRDQRGPERDQRGPARDQQGPARDQQGPARDQRGPARDQRGPSRDQRGPARDQRGPSRDQRGPTPQQGRSQRGQPQPARQQQQRQQQRQQRPAQRPGPEVIVLKRRVPEPTSKPEPETNDAVRGATNRRRR